MYIAGVGRNNSSTPFHYFPSEEDSSYLIRDEKGEVLISLGEPKEPCQDIAHGAVLAYAPNRKYKSVKQLMDEQGVVYTELPDDGNIEAQLDKCEPGRLYYAHLKVAIEDLSWIVCNYAVKGVYLIIETPDIKGMTSGIPYEEYLKVQLDKNYKARSWQEYYGGVKELLYISWVSYGLAGSEPVEFEVDRDLVMPVFEFANDVLMLGSKKCPILMSSVFEKCHLKDALQKSNVQFIDLSEEADSVQYVSSFGEDNSLLGKLKRCQPQKLYYLRRFDEDIATIITEKAKAGSLFILELEDAPYVPNEFLEEFANVVYPSTDARILVTLPYGKDACLRVGKELVVSPHNQITAPFGAAPISTGKNKDFVIQGSKIRMKPGTIIITNQKLPTSLKEFAANSGLREGRDYKYTDYMLTAKIEVISNGEDCCYIFECIGEHWGDNEFFDKHAYIISYGDGSYWVSKRGQFKMKIQ